MRVRYSDPVIQCARAGRYVSALECCSTVCATERREDLDICRLCAHGRALALTSRLPVNLPPLPQPLPPSLPAGTERQCEEYAAAAIVSPQKEKSDPTVIQKTTSPQKAVQSPKKRSAPKKTAISPDVAMRMQLARTLARLLADFPQSKTHGLRFFLLAAEQFDFAGSADDAVRLLLAAGLHMTTGSRPAIRVDDALRAFATQGSTL